METITPGLEQALIFLIYTTVIMLIVLIVFVVKLLVETSNLVRSLQELTIVLNHELEPTIKELKKTLDNINSIASTADKQVDAMKKVLGGAVESASGVLGKARGVSVSFIDGILAGLKLFIKAKKK